MKTLLNYQPACPFCGINLSLTSLLFCPSSCLLRIVDSFGTEPAFNLRSFAKQRKKLTSWGGQDLQLQQFYTMFRKYTVKLLNFRTLTYITVNTLKFELRGSTMV